VTHSHAQFALRLAFAAGSALAATGCGGPTLVPRSQWADTERAATNAWTIQDANAMQVENAIARQRTLFAHQFVDGTAALNARGRRDLAVLLERVAPRGDWTLTVTRAGAPPELYDARLETVRAAVGDAGFDPDRLTLLDHPASAGGIPSSEAAASYRTPSAEEPFDFHTGGGGDQ